MSDAHYNVLLRVIGKQQKGAKMPHSLRAKIKGLRYKGIITDKDCDRLCKALDNEGVLNKIRTEIDQIKPYDLPSCERTAEKMISRVLDIIDKYGNEVIE